MIKLNIVKRYKTMKKTTLLALLILFLSGCAFTQHDLTLDSETVVSLAPIAEEVTIVITLSDERDSPNVGKRVGGFGAKITAADLMSTIEKAVHNTFAKKGYRVVAGDSSHDALVEVNIRAFKYEVMQGWWTYGEHVSAVFIIEATRNGNDFKKVYRASDENRIFFESYGSELDEKMSNALRDVLVQIAQDQELEKFLVTGNKT